MSVKLVASCDDVGSDHHHVMVKRTNSESKAFQLEAMSVVIAKLNEEKSVRKDHDKRTLQDMVILEPPSQVHPESPASSTKTTKKDKKTTLFKSLKRKKSESKVKEAPIKPATFYFAELIKRDTDKATLEALLQILEKESSKSTWMELFTRLDGFDILFQFLYPYKRCTDPEVAQLILIVLQCIFLVLQKPSYRKEILQTVTQLKNVELPEDSNDTEPEIPQQESKRGIPMKQRNINIRSPPIRNSTPILSSGKKSGVRLSNLQILLSLYCFVTSEPVPILVLPTIRILNFICQCENGSDMVLTELYRIDRVIRKSGFFASLPLAKSMSEESLRITIRGQAESLINPECLYLLPLINPLKDHKCGHLAECWNLLNAFIIHFKDVTSRFLVQNTALQLGILPIVLGYKQQFGAELGTSLETQLEVFHQCLEDDYEEMAQKLSPAEMIKFSSFRESSEEGNFFRVSLPYLQRTVVTIPFTEETTIEEIIRRAIKKQQYLQADEISNLIAMNFSDFGLYIQPQAESETSPSARPRTVSKGNFSSSTTTGGEKMSLSNSENDLLLLNEWLEDITKTTKDYNLKGEVLSKIDLIPWTIFVQVRIECISPRGTSSKISESTTYSVSPNQPIQLLLQQLKLDYASSEIFQTPTARTLEYGFYWVHSKCWLDPAQKWTSYPLLNDKEHMLKNFNLLTFTVRYKPLKIKFEHRFCEIELLLLGQTIQQVFNQAIEKLNIPSEKAGDYCIFLFPRSLTPIDSPDCSASCETQGWIEEERRPGTYVLGQSLTLRDLLAQYPKLDFLLRCAIQPKQLLVRTKFLHPPVPLPTSSSSLLLGTSTTTNDENDNNMNSGYPNTNSSSNNNVDKENTENSFPLSAHPHDDSDDHSCVNSVDTGGESVEMEKEILVYYSAPVKDTIKVICTALGIRTQLSYLLAIENPTAASTNEVTLKWLRKTVSLRDQLVSPSLPSHTMNQRVVYLSECTEVSDDPFDDEANIWDIKETSDSVIFGNTEQEQIKAGTFNILVRYLTSDKVYDSDFMDTFLHTYQSFTSSRMLLKKLIERFNAPPSIPTDVQRIVQQKVCVVLKHWVTKCMNSYSSSLLKEAACLYNVNSASGSSPISPPPSSPRSPLAASPTCAYNIVNNNNNSNNYFTMNETDSVSQQLLLGEIAAFAETAVRVLPAATALQKTVANKLAGITSNSKDNYKFKTPAPASLFKVSLPLPANQPMSLDVVDTTEMARQLTLVSFEMFRTIRMGELFGQPWCKQNTQYRCPNLMANIQFFNAVSSWVTSSIVKTTILHERAKLYSKFVQLAVTLRELGNFSLVTAVISGLNSSAVSRLHWTKVKLTKRQISLFHELETLVSMSNSFKQYRIAVTQHGSPVVPYIGVYLSDLTFIDDGNPDIVQGGLINFHKRTMMFNTLKQMEMFQQVPFNFTPVPEIQEWIKTFEIVNEDTLYELSLDIEPRNAQRIDIR